MLPMTEYCEQKELQVEEGIVNHSQTQSKYEQLNQLLDPNDGFMVKTAWEYVKFAIEQNHLLSNHQTLEAITNALQQINDTPASQPNTHNTNKHFYSFKTVSFLKTNTKSINQTTENPNELTLQINQEKSNIPATQSNKGYDTIIPDEHLTNDDCIDVSDIHREFYKDRARPLMLLQFMSNDITLSLNVYHKLLDLNIAKQCNYLNCSLPSSAETISHKIKNELNLTLTEIEPLKLLLTKYYNIILKPKEVNQTTLSVLIATIISNAIGANISINDIKTWQSLYCLFEYLKQIQNENGNLEDVLLSIERSKLASMLSKKVVDKYDVNAQIIEKVVACWIQKDMAFKAVECSIDIISSSHKSLVYIGKNITKTLMKRDDISQHFDNECNVFHNINRIVKMQAIDKSYKVYKNNIGCTELKLTVFSSRIKNKYIVTIRGNIDKNNKINAPLTMKDLLSVHEMKNQFGIESNDLPMDLMQRRADKLLHGYIRELIGDTRYIMLHPDVISFCQEFFNYNEYKEHEYCKQNIIISCVSTVPKQIITQQTKAKHKLNPMCLSMRSAEFYKYVEEAITNQDNKYKCISIITIANNKTIYYKHEILPVKLLNDNWIGVLIRSNTIHALCTDWNDIKTKAKAYDITFNPCKEWKNDMTRLSIQPSKRNEIINMKIPNDNHTKTIIKNIKGFVSEFDYKKPFGFIVCHQSHNSYLFSKKEFQSNNSILFVGLEVYFDVKNNDSKAINVRPIDIKYYGYNI